MLLDWLHLVSGSLWIGGLIGLLVLWRSLPAAKRVAGLAVCVPRFSNVAFVSVLVLLGTGVGAAVLHLPVLDALWLTSYGKVILIKAGILLAAMLLASVNLLRNKPGLARPRGRAKPRRKLLRALVSRRGRARRRRDPRRRRPLEPRPAATGVCRGGLGARAGRPRQGRLDGRPRRLQAPGSGRPQPGGGAGLVRAPPDPRAASRSTART